MVIQRMFMLIILFNLLNACSMDVDGVSCDSDGCEVYRETLYCDDRFCGNVITNSYKNLVFEYEGFIYKTDGQKLIAEYPVLYNDQTCTAGNEIMKEHYFDRDDNYIVATKEDGNLYYSNNTLARFTVKSPYKLEELSNYCMPDLDLYEMNYIMQEVNVRARPWFLDQEYNLLQPLDYRDVSI